MGCIVAVSVNPAEKQPFSGLKKKPRPQFLCYESIWLPNLIPAHWLSLHHHLCFQSNFTQNSPKLLTLLDTAAQPKADVCWIWPIPATTTNMFCTSIFCTWAKPNIIGQFFFFFFFFLGLLGVGILWKMLRILVKKCERLRMANLVVKNCRSSVGFCKSK